MFTKSLYASFSYGRWKREHIFEEQWTFEENYLIVSIHGIHLRNDYGIFSSHEFQIQFFSGHGDISKTSIGEQFT
jgi:hypothetical protein